MHPPRNGPVKSKRKQYAHGARPPARPRPNRRRRPDRLHAPSGGSGAPGTGGGRRDAYRGRKEPAMTPALPVTTPCSCHSSAHTTDSYDTRVRTESACDRCGSRGSVMMPAAYIGCFLSDRRGPQGHSVLVWCGSCGLYRYEPAGDVHMAGCPVLTTHYARQLIRPPRRLPPAPDPMHVRHHAVGAQ